MAVQPQPHRSTWTDERLGDLAEVVRDGFTANHADHQSFRDEMQHGFSRLDGRFNHLESRIDGLQRTLIIGLFGLTGTMIAALAAVLIKL